MSRPKLVVLGNACLDVTYHLDRLPKPGETLITRGRTIGLGGKGLNQAIAAHRAGADVHLIAAIGNDATADRIRAMLRDEGMSDSCLVTADGPSDESVLLLDPEGENIIVSTTQRAQSLTPASIDAVVGGADLLLLQGNLTEETTFHAMQLARAAKVKVAINPSPFHAWFVSLPRVDLIVANQGEADALGEIKADMAVITLGQKGCRLRSAAQEVTIPAPRIDAISTAGAGDVFAGTFIAEWLMSNDSERAARLAVAAASDKATRPGTLSAFPQRSAIDMFRRALK